MKKIFTIFLTLGLLFSISTPAFAYVSVRGYFRSNGTYVQPYVRSNPNAFKSDNYGYTGGNAYNKSYSAPTKNYSSSWYTPTYYTDSSYYMGKSIYNRSHGY
jgi:hypothetical protein